MDAREQKKKAAKGKATFTQPLMAPTAKAKGAKKGKAGKGGKGGKTGKGAGGKPGDSCILKI